MVDKPTYDELESRIKAVARFYGGKLPVEHALVWQGYIGALSEWGLISIQEHERLHDLLGRIPAAPMLHISLGPQGADELMKREGIEDLSIRPKPRARPAKVGHRR
jgi:muconolactone delta-isomerase